MSVSIMLGTTFKSAEDGSPYTITGNRVVSWTNNLELYFTTDGWYTYNGFTRVGKAGQDITLYVKGKKLVTDIVVYSGIYGADYPFPPEISTAAEMDNILEEATDELIGAIYKYIGATTSTYEHGAIYTVVEE
jgi:hypothetical protein